MLVGGRAGEAIFERRLRQRLYAILRRGLERSPRGFAGSSCPPTCGALRLLWDCKSYTRSPHMGIA